MFRFTIRDVFWLTLVAALALGWWGDHRLTARRHQQEKDALRDEIANLLHESTNYIGARD